MADEREPRVLREAREVAAAAARRRTPDGRYAAEAASKRRGLMKVSLRDRWLLILAVGLGMVIAFYLLDDFWPALAESAPAKAAGEAVVGRIRPKPAPKAQGRVVPVEADGGDEGPGEGDEGGDEAEE